MPAADLVTAEDLAEFRDGDPDAIVRQVQAAIRRYCGWHIAPSLTETILVDGSGSRHMWLPTLHLTELVEVKSSGEVMDADLIDWSASGYLESRCGRFSSRPRGVEVTLTHGYDDSPADLVGVAVGIADRSRSTGGARREAAGAVSIDFATFNGVAGSIALLQHEIDLLAQYKLPPRA